MVCRNCRISLYTLNGDLILDQAACEQNDDDILSCAFYEGFGNEWLERELLFTGHRKGLVNVRFSLRHYTAKLTVWLHRSGIKSFVMEGLSLI